MTKVSPLRGLICYTLQYTVSMTGTISFDNKNTGGGASTISVVKTDPYRTYAGAYAVDGTVIDEGVPELIQRYILSGETDTDAWDKIVEKIDVLIRMMDNLFGVPEFDKFENIVEVKGFGLFVENRNLLNSINAQRKAGKKFLFKPNWVTPLEDIDSAFVLQPGPNGKFVDALDPNETNFFKRGEGWGGSTAWPFMAALLYWFNWRLKIDLDNMLVGEGGDKSEFDVALMNKIAGLLRPDLPPFFTLPAIYEGKIAFNSSGMPDPDGTPVWYGGIGMYWARRYLKQRTNDKKAMDGYVTSLKGTYVPPSKAKGITIYNTNDVSSAGSKDVINVPQTIPKPWNKGVYLGNVVTSITVHKVFTDSSVGFLVNCPKLKVHPLGNITCALKNLGIGIPAAWAKDNSNWIYELPQNANDTGIPCEKWNIPHEFFHGAVDRYGVPFLDGQDLNPYNINLPTGVQIPCPHYKTYKTGGMGGFIMDANLALKSKFGSNILHIVDGVVAANAWHEASRVKALKISLVNEGMVFASDDPVALDKFALRYVYKKFKTSDLREQNIQLYQAGAFFNYAFKSKYDAITGQLYGSIGPDITTTESSDNRTAWAKAAGLGTDQYYVVGKIFPPLPKKWLLWLPPLLRPWKWLSSINGHLVADVHEPWGPGPFHPVEVISPNVYYTASPRCSLFETGKGFATALDDLTSAILNGPLLLTPHRCWPDIKTNKDFFYGRLVNYIAPSQYPPNTLQMDELGGDTSILGYGTVANVPRDIILKHFTDNGAEKAQFYGNYIINRCLDPFWNNGGPKSLPGLPAGVPGHYFFGYSQFNTVILVAWKLATRGGPVPANPHVANADWFFYSLTTTLGKPHLMIYGTYNTEITHVIDPTGQPVSLAYFGLPTLPAGTYWPSGHFVMWATSIFFLYGQDFFDLSKSPDARISGSEYEAAKLYADVKKYTLKLYVPKRFYSPLYSYLVSAGILGNIVPLPDLEDGPGYDPTKFFKAEFYDSNNVLKETWPDNFAI